MTFHLTAPIFDGDAACAAVGGDAWFPEPGGEGLMVARQAKAVCAGCEIRLPCLQWALDNIEHGIWGGTTDRERARMVGKRRTGHVAPHGTEAGYKAHYRRAEKPCESCRVAAARARAERDSA